VLEVDEAWLGRVAAQVRPSVIVLLNLSRDQLDRNNEVRHIAQRWRQACQEATGAVVVANADDPLVAWAAGQAERALWVGAGLRWRNDATGCPDCGGTVLFSEGTDEWHCQKCGFSRPQPDIWLATGPGGARAELAAGESYPLQLRLPGRCNQANAVMAMAGVLGAGGTPAAALGAMAGVEEVSGRYAIFEVAGVRARLLLAKNPAGWAEVFDMLAPAPTPVVVAINARTADGHDPSWLWDVPFEALRGRPAIATGERGLDMAVRLHYAQVDHALVPDLVEALEAAGQRGRAGGTAGDGQVHVDVVANYTSFHQLLARLGRGPGAGRAQEPGPQEPGPQEPGPQEPGPQEPGPQEPGPQEPGPAAGGVVAL
jgi:UDP-N-acetylmuramyl tripeptide synthase